MGILRDFEKRLEGAVEGFFARAFRSGLQPVELAKAIQRYAANYKQVGIDGIYAPNVYRFGLAPDDFERFSGFEGSLRHELADVARRTATERGWRLQGPVRIELKSDDDVRVGTYELRGKIEAPPEPPPSPRERPPRREAPRAPAPAPDAGGHTVVLPTTRPKATLRIDAGPGAGRELPLGATTIVGRLPQSDVVLEDPSVSRRHARIIADGARWTIEDLGSTNGVIVNGDTVPRAALEDGDRVELGGVRLSFILKE